MLRAAPKALGLTDVLSLGIFMIRAQRDRATISDESTMSDVKPGLIFFSCVGASFRGGSYPNCDANFLLISSLLVSFCRLRPHSSVLQSFNGDTTCLSLHFCF